MTDFTALAELYLQVWNEGDAARRRELAGDLFAATCVFTDPLASVQVPTGSRPSSPRDSSSSPGITCAWPGRWTATTTSSGSPGNW